MYMRRKGHTGVTVRTLVIIVFFLLFCTAHTVKAEVTMNQGQVTLTDENKTFELKAESTDPLSSVEWVCSDKSVVTWDSNWNSGTTRWGVTLKALKNGTADVRLVGPNGTIYASCTVTCTDLTVPYGVQAAGIEITNRNYQSVTGSGISGTVIYHPDTNTLTLKNAVLTCGGDGETYCVVLYRGRKGQTLNVELIGKNVIRNVSWAPYTGDRYINTFSYTGGDALGSSEGGFCLKGSGSLIVQDSGIGTGVSCSELRIAEGTTLDLQLSGGSKSIGLEAGSVTIDGTFRSSQTASTSVRGISASKLVIGKSGDVQIQVKNTNGTTNLSVLTTDAIHLPWGGSAEISGSLKASAVDSEKDICTGRCIAGSRSDQPSSVVVKESGKMELSADLDAFQYVNLSLAKGLVLNAGTDKKSALTMDTVDDENYVQIGKDLPVIRETQPEKVTAECTKHIFGKWEVTKKASYTANGSKKRVCSKCGSVEKASIARLKVKTGAVLSNKTGSYKILKGLKTAAFAAPVKKTVKTFTIPASVKLAGKTYKVTKIQAKAFSGCQKLTKVIIGKNVTEIGAGAFFNCGKLANATIGAGVKTIGKQAFFGCSALKTVIIRSRQLTLKKTGAEAFRGIFKKAVITVPKGKEKEYRSILEKKGSGKAIKTGI